MYGLEKRKGTITALSPLFSGGNEKTGITLSLNRLKYLVNGEAVDVPLISGNEVRGYLRRLIFQDYLSLAGYKLDLEKKPDQALFHTLFSGGILETVEEKVSGTIDLTFKRTIYENILPARLFGFSFGNQMIEGKLKVSHMLPICKELANFLPAGYETKLSLYEMLGQEFQTRRDDIRAVREEKEQAVQMIIEHEVFAPGSQFYHEFIIEDPDPLSSSTLTRMIELWEGKPFIGGKSSIGFGRLAIKYEGAATSREYELFIESNAGKINAVLDSLKGLFS